MIWTKETNQSTKFQTFDCSREVSQNSYFDRILFFVSKIRICCILTWALEIFKISTPIGPFCAKCITFDLIKYGGVIFHQSKEWCKIWRKTDLWFKKWREKYSKFSSEHLKNLRIGTLMEFLLSKAENV